MKRHEAMRLREGDRVERLQAKFPHSTNQWQGIAAYLPTPGKQYYPGTIIYQDKSSTTAWHIDVYVIKNGVQSKRPDKFNTQSVAIPQPQEQKAA